MQGDLQQFYALDCFTTFAMTGGLNFNERVGKMKKEYLGFSLLEVLISLVLLTFILLGVDAIEMVTLQNNQASYFSSVAENQLHSISQQLCSAGNSINTSEIIAAWNQENEILLPQ